MKSFWCEKEVKWRKWNKPWGLHINFCFFWQIWQRRQTGKHALVEDAQVQVVGEFEVVPNCQGKQKFKYSWVNHALVTNLLCLYWKVCTEIVARREWMRTVHRRIHASEWRPFSSHWQVVWTFDFQEINTLKTLPGCFFSETLAVFWRNVPQGKALTGCDHIFSPFTSNEETFFPSDRRTCHWQKRHDLQDWTTFQNCWLRKNWQIVFNVKFSENFWEKTSYWGKKMTECGGVDDNSGDSTGPSWEPRSSHQLKLQQLEEQENWVCRSTGSTKQQHVMETTKFLNRAHLCLMSNFLAEGCEGETSSSNFCRLSPRWQFGGKAHASISFKTFSCCEFTTLWTFFSCLSVCWPPPFGTQVAYTVKCFYPFQVFFVAWMSFRSHERFCEQEDPEHCWAPEVWLWQCKDIFNCWPTCLCLWVHTTSCRVTCHEMSLWCPIVAQDKFLLPISTSGNWNLFCKTVIGTPFFDSDNCTNISLFVFSLNHCAFNWFLSISWLWLLFCIACIHGSVKAIFFLSTQILRSVWLKQTIWTRPVDTTESEHIWEMWDFWRTGGHLAAALELPPMSNLPWHLEFLLSVLRGKENFASLSGLSWTSVKTGKNANCIEGSTYEGNWSGCWNPMSKAQLVCAVGSEVHFCTELFETDMFHCEMNYFEQVWTCKELLFFFANFQNISKASSCSLDRRGGLQSGTISWKGCFCQQTQLMSQASNFSPWHEVQQLLLRKLKSRGLFIWMWKKSCCSKSFEKCSGIPVIQWVLRGGERKLKGVFVLGRKFSSTKFLINFFK